MAVITIGPGATDRTALGGASYTLIILNGAADGTGIITSFEVWFNSEGLSVKIGTFYGSDTSYTNRDYETIGTVAAGSKQTFSGLECDVVTGDYAGIYWSSGGLERDNTGGLGIYYKLGDQFGAGEQTYELVGNFIYSIYGTGATAPVEYERSASVIIGNLVSATRGQLTGTRASSTLVGALVSASRVRGRTRTVLVLVGNLVTAIKPGLTLTRLSSVIVGALVTAKAVTGVQRAIVYIGVKVTASRNITKALAAATVVGIVATASGIVAYIRASSTIIGTVVTAVHPPWARSRASSVIVGIVSTATRVITATRTSSIQLGIVTSATRALTATRKAAIKVGTVISALGLIIGRVLKMLVYGRPYYDMSVYTRPYYDMEVYNL